METEKNYLENEDQNNEIANDKEQPEILIEKITQRDPEKLARINELREQINRMCDGQGLEIDNGIKETVLYFMANDFKTQQSCEGHIDGKHGLPFPWIQVGPEEMPDESYDKKEYIEQYDKIIDKLDRFYQDRDVSTDKRLSLHYLRGAFRVQSTGGFAIDKLPEEEQLKRFAGYKEEMADFTKFLERDYFGENQEMQNNENQ